MGVAAFVMMATGRTQQSAALLAPTTFSTGFAVWLLLGDLGLVAGLIASRRRRPAPAEQVALWEPSTIPLGDHDKAVPQSADRFGATLEAVRDSA